MSFRYLQFLPKNKTKIRRTIVVVKLKFFVCYFEETLAEKNHFDFVWPLVAYYGQTQYRFYQSEDTRHKLVWYIIILFSNLNATIFINLFNWLLRKLFLLLPELFFWIFFWIFKKNLILFLFTLVTISWISLLNMTIRERSLMTSLVFWSFLTYLPTLSYSITSLFWAILDPPTYPNMGHH